MPRFSDTIVEVDSRRNAGIEVTLSGYFNVSGDCEYAIVTVDSPDENFSISEIPLGNALDVFNHPFYYANRELATGKVAA